MQVIGITGNIASGKTTVARAFKARGAIVINADKVAHRALFRGTECYKSLIRTFGPGILNPDKSISRRKLAAAAFASPANYRRLNTIVHPWMIREIERKIRNLKARGNKKTVFVEAAVLIECGLYKKMDRVITVKSGTALPLERINKQGKITPAQARARLSYQLPEKQKIKFADYVINNRGTFEDIEAQVSKLWNNLKN